MNLEVEKLVEAGKITEAVGEKLSLLQPGSICSHKSWGVGKVSGWDLLGNHITIDFEDKPGHKMALTFAFKSVDPLEEGHILAQRILNKEDLVTLAKEDPVDLVRKTLQSFSGSMSLDQLEEVVKGRIVGEEQYKSWWDATKKKLREGREFVVPSKRNLPLELRPSDISVADALVAEFLEARDLKAKVSVLDLMLKDPEAFEQPEEQLKPVVDDINSAAPKGLKLYLGQAVALVLGRNQLQARTEGLKTEGEIDLNNVLNNERSRLPELLSGLPVASQRQIYEAMPEAFGDEWINEVLNQLNQAGARNIVEIARLLNEKGKEKELEEFLKLGLQQRSLSSELLAWVCKERKKSTAPVFDHEIAPAILNSLEKDHYDEESRKSGRLHDLIMDDRELILDLLVSASFNQVRNFSRRLLMSPVFEELNKRSLMARIVKEYPKVQDLITGSSKDAEKTEELIVSWESLERRKEELTDIIKKKIPENTKEIAVARSYGDLKENFEYKAAKDMQRVLMRRQGELEHELSIAKGTDFKDAATDSVSIGTIVEVKGKVNTETFTILGAWDTEVEKGIISYLSAVGQSLLGKAVGEDGMLTTEDGDERPVQVVSIKPFIV